MKKIFAPVLVSVVFLAGIVLTSSTDRADTYDWVGPEPYQGGNGDFGSAQWLDADTPVAPFEPPNYMAGPPGGGDSAYVPENSILSGSGSVDTLDTAAAFGGGLNGSFTCNTLGSVLLTGGSLTAGHVGTVPSDSAEDLFIQGGQMTAGSADSPVVNVTSGGSLVISSSIPRGEGSASGQGSSFTVDGALQNFNGGASSGGMLKAQSIQSNNGLSGMTYCDGAGSLVTTAGTAEYDGQGTQVTGGGAFSISGNLLLYPDPTNVSHGGTVYLDGSGSTLTVGGETILGTNGSTAIGASYLGFIMLSNGAVMTTGSLSADGPLNGAPISLDTGALLQINSGLMLGLSNMGSLTVQGGSGVKLIGNATIGSASGSNGRFTISGSGSYLNARSNSMVLGADSGSTGTVELDTSAAMQFNGGTLFVGDGGSGSLSLNTGSALTVLGTGSDVLIGELSGNGIVAASQGSLGASGGSTINVAGTMEVGGESTGSLSVDGAGSIVQVAGTFTVSNTARSTGTVSISNGAQLIGSADDNTIGRGNGSIAVQDAGSNLTLKGQTIIGGDIANGAASSAMGSITVSNGATAQLSVAQLGATVGASGMVSVEGSGSKLTVTDALNVGGGSLSAAGILAAEGSGVVTVAQDALVTVARTLRVSARGAIQVAPSTGDTAGGGRMYVGTDNTGPTGAIRIGHNGIFSGQGHVSGSTVVAQNVIGDVILGAGGRFQPGGDPNVFNIVGDCDLSDGGKGGGETDIEVAGTGKAGTAYDQLIASGKVTAGGTLKLVLMPGYQPKVGDTLDPVKAKTMAGSFQEVVSPGLTFYHEVAGGKVSVKVMSVADVPAPAITSEKTATAQAGTAFTYQIKATGLPAGYGAKGLPAGLDIDPSTGLISGTPTAAGASSVKLTSTSVGGTGTATLELTVHAAVEAGAPVITSATSDSAAPGVAFSYQIVASNAPASFAATDLPAGLSVNPATGLISGQPKKAGTFMVTLSASNASGTGTATLKLIVALPVVKVVANVPVVAIGGGKAGEFTFSIPEALKAPLTIHYKVSGSAKPGTDYDKLTGTAIIKTGKKKVVVNVVPKGNLDGVGSKIVKLTLEKSTVYSLGGIASAKVTIITAE